MIECNDWRAMTDRTLDLAAAAPIGWRQHAVTAGRLALAVLLLIVWKLGADIAGPIYVADPFKVFERIVADTWSGAMIRHVYVTLRLSAIGFAIGCAAGVALPFLLRRLPRLTAAVEPYIMASVGIPKYALVPLFILWFGIDDAPKLWLVGLLVFYPVFIAVFAGIRNVDRRLIDMARIVGASETAISREVIWNSLLPFFFAVAEDRAAARRERRHHRRVSGRQRGARLPDREFAPELRHHRRVRRNRGGDRAGARDQCRAGVRRPPVQRLAPDRPQHAAVIRFRGDDRILPSPSARRCPTPAA